MVCVRTPLDNVFIFVFGRMSEPGNLRLYFGRYRPKCLAPGSTVNKRHGCRDASLSNSGVFRKSQGGGKVWEGATSPKEGAVRSSF